VRDTKFRAWDKNTNSMCSSSIIAGENIKGYIYSHGCPEQELVEDSDLVIMQFTGLQDYKGIDIFEGDIIEIKPYNKDRFESNLYVIKWDKNYCRFIMDSEVAWKGSICQKLLKEYKVIGNIYENPELFNKEET